MPKPPSDNTGPPPWAAIAFLSGAALGYEILLTRLLSIVHWHHFAYMVISLALLGYGASGTFLSLAERRLSKHFPALFFANALLFGLSATGCFLGAQRVGLNPLELPWDAGQLGRLLAVYVLLAVPFFGVANSIGLALWAFARQTHRIYAVDLLGAGVGAAGVVGLLFLAPPERALLIVSSLGILAAGLSLTGRRPSTGVFVCAAALLVALAPGRWIALQIGEYKDLAQALAVMGAKPVAELSGPLGRVTVVRNDQVPFRFAPGMSLVAASGPPEQIALFVDADSIGAATRFDGRHPPPYLDALTSALPYQLLERPKVLILGAGGGAAVLQALLHDPYAVEAVEVNPDLIALLRGKLAAFSGNLYDLPRVHLRIAEARAFLARDSQRYDLIQIDLLDAFGSAAAGLRAQSESYLYTVEALSAYLQHLEPDGLLAVTRWLRLPPRDALKLTATARAALERLDEARPASHIAMIRGWKTTTLLVKRSPLAAPDLEAIKRFARDRSFDVAYYPGIDVAEANRYNRLDAPLFYEGVHALLGPDARQFTEAYKFDITPATDDRPYFFDTARWRTLPELLRMPAHGGLAQLDMGYWVLVATLLQAGGLGVALILGPLLAFRRNTSCPRGIRWKTLAYFGSIGLAFMFLEIAFIQRFTLVLGHPIYAVSVVLAGFLVFAGLGSAASGRLPNRRLALWGVASAIALVATTLSAGLAILGPSIQALPAGARIAIGLACLAPLAFFMGMPFPVGMSRVGSSSRDLIPWAWGINGCASVIGAVLAVLLAMEIGFGGLVLTAITGYALAALSLPAHEDLASDPG